MFSRTSILYGKDACEKLKNARVVVCGVGAVGSFAVEALARLGVGEFVLYDFDVFEKSNINRQLCALNSTLEKTKVDVQKARILDINPNAKVDAQNLFIDADVARKISESKPSVIVDAIDNISSKVELARFANEFGVRLVSSMGAARRKNPLEIKTADIFKTMGCPLASRIRKELRRAGITKGFKCVYSSEVVEKSTDVSSEDNSGEKVIGSSVIITGAFGLHLANLAIADILSQ